MNKNETEHKHLIMRYLFLVLGHVFLLVGIIGVFLPILPTTPFLLLAAWCYSKGSSTFEHWLLNHKYLGPPVLAWRTHRVVRPSAKILAATVMTTSLIWVWMKESIPLVGKIAMTATLIPVLAFVLTRRNSAPASLHAGNVDSQ
jgi:uncharacterized membrane protein YbaN (DUF454 family)